MQVKLRESSLAEAYDADKCASYCYRYTLERQVMLGGLWKGSRGLDYMEVDGSSTSRIVAVGASLEPQKRKKRWLRGLTVTGIALALLGYVERDTILSKTAEKCATRSGCIGEAMLRGHFELDPVPSVSRFKRLDKKGDASFASWRVYPNSLAISTSCPVYDSKKKPTGKTTSCYMIGIGLLIDKSQLDLVFRDTAGKPLPPGRILQTGMLSIMGVNNCVQDMRAVVEAAQRAAYNLEYGNVTVGERTATVEPAMILGAENQFAVFPYTNVRDDPDIPNLVPYYTTKLSGNSTVPAPITDPNATIISANCG